MLVIALKWNVYVSYKQQASKEKLQGKKCSVTLSSKVLFGKMPWWIDQCKNCLVAEIWLHDKMSPCAKYQKTEYPHGQNV